MDIYPRRLNLKKPTNVRDLGGYMRDDGKVTKYGEFLRSNLLAELEEADIDFLKAYGLKTVVDLRSDHEIKLDPSAFEDCEGIDYINIPLLSDIHPRIDKDNNLGAMYMVMLEKNYNIARLFNYMADHAEGTLLFNCTAGKDRTGITACLLLMLAGIDKLDISADYQVSSTYVKKMLEEQFVGRFKEMDAMTEEELEAKKEMYQHAVESKPEYIENFYDGVMALGGAEAYLRSVGVSQENIDILKNKLI